MRAEMLLDTVDYKVWLAKVLELTPEERRSLAAAVERLQARFGFTDLQAEGAMMQASLEKKAPLSRLVGAILAHAESG